jgi:hypothetical protein
MHSQNSIRYGLVLTVLTVLLAIAAMVAAAPNIKLNGTLAAVEEQGKVAIITTKSENTNKESTKAYHMSTYTLVIDGRGRKATLDKYPIPSIVEFEVEYTLSGPVIKKIREIPQ